jgi:hypothetical protein
MLVMLWARVTVKVAVKVTVFGTPQVPVGAEVGHVLRLGVVY